MVPQAPQPKDRRTHKIRKKIKKVGKDLTDLQVFLEGLPAEIRDDAKRQFQKAFEAGCAYSEIQNLPQTMPLSEDGMVQIGPALRYHIMQTRKVYADIDQLREIVSNIFDQKSQQMLRKIMRQEEDVRSGSEVIDIVIGDL